MSASKVVLVTGASSGIGAACAAMLHARGHVVYGTSRKTGAPGAGWRWLQLDVTDGASVEAAVARILAEQGRLDVVVNNAGMVLAGAIEDTSLEEARVQIDTNLLGAFRVIKAALPSMRERRYGLVINVGSLAGVVGLPFQGFYSASKFALEGFTEALRLEVASFGVRAVIIEPGDIRTGVVENRVRVAGSRANSPYAGTFEKVVATFEKEEKAGASPDVVARRVVALVEGGSPAVRYSVGPAGQRILSMLKRVLPSTWFEFGLAVYYGLKRS